MSYDGERKIITNICFFFKIKLLFCMIFFFINVNVWVIYILINFMCLKLYIPYLLLVNVSAPEQGPRKFVQGKA
jgi:sugar phosphate permease